LIGSAGSRAENPDCDASITSCCVCDGRQLLGGNHSLTEPPPDAIFENRDEFVKRVFLEMDASSSLKAAHETVIEPRGQLLLAMGEQHHREATRSIDIVEDSRVFDLVNFVEEDDVRRSFVCAQAFEKFALRGGLAENVEGAVETFEEA